MQGKLCKRGLVLVVLFLVNITAASAQAPDPQSVTGKIENKSEGGQIRFETIMQHKDVPYETMKMSMFGVFSIVTHAPAVNPRYYNPALPRSIIQLIVINYHTSNFCPLFLKQRLADWFQQIGYNKLSTLLAGL